MKQVLLVLILSVIVIAVSCKDDNSTQPQATSFQITILVGEDTLHYLPGDSASTTVTVILFDLEGDVVPAHRVEMSVTNSQLGFLEYLNPQLRDTSDAYGRIHMLYYSVGSPGLNIITATCDHVSNYARIIALTTFDDPQELLVMVTSDTVHYLSTDSTEVLVRVTDYDHSPVVGELIPLVISAGRIGGSIITDSTGEGSTWYWPPHETGVYWIRGYHLIYMDSASVRVEP